MASRNFEKNRMKERKRRQADARAAKIKKQMGPRNKNSTAMMKVAALAAFIR
ncbi:MAG: hypothetical protein Q7R45_08355 [Sulfuricaulis sp.]|nr:hypothetical protein [Sulfuricaulis sp.]